MFKIGDKVVCLTDDSSQMLNRTLRYIVTNVSACGLFVELEGMAGIYWQSSWFESTFHSLPDGYKLREPYFKTNEDCQGHTHTCWECDIINPDGRFILGFGASKEQATQDAIKKCGEDIVYRLMSPTSKIKHIMEKSKKQGRFYDRDLVDILEAIVSRLEQK